MINNIISIVLLVVIFRIIFEILFFSKSIKEGFIENDNDKDNGCCPDNNYTYKTYPVPNNCIDGEDNISCLRFLNYQAYTKYQLRVLKMKLYLHYDMLI